VERFNAKIVPVFDTVENWPKELGRMQVSSTTTRQEFSVIILICDGDDGFQ
jgi:hypothetical protein